MMYPQGHMNRSGGRRCFTKKKKKKGNKLVFNHAEGQVLHSTTGQERLKHMTHDVPECPQETAGRLVPEE